MSSLPTHINTTDTLSTSISSTMKDPDLDPLDLSTLLGIHPLPTPLYTIDDCFHAVSASWEQVQSKDQDEEKEKKSLTPHQRLIATLHRRERVEDVAQLILNMYQHAQDGIDGKVMPAASASAYLSHPSHRQILHQLQSIARNASSASRVMPTTWTAPLGLHCQMQKLRDSLKMDIPPIVPSHPTLADVRTWLNIVGEHLQCPPDLRQGLFSRPTRWQRHGTPLSIYGHRQYNRVWRAYRHLQFTCRTALQQQEKQLQHMIQRAGLAHVIPYMYQQMEHKQEHDDKQHEEKNELEDDDSSYVFVAPGGAAVPYWEIPSVSSSSSSSSLPPLTDSHTIAFIAYQTAMLHRRTEFCPDSSQPTRYDEMSDALLQQCIIHSHTTQWIWIAHIHANSEVFHHLSEMELTSLLLTWRKLLHHFSALLQRMWPSINKRCSRQRMIVQCGVDSTGWNICAGAYCTARRHWMQLLTAMKKEHILEIECLPKVCCLVAGDVAVASQWGRGMHIDVGICASLPQVWEVLSGRVPCTRSAVEAACNPTSSPQREQKIRDWYQISTSVTPVAYRVTPHLIHGVVQANNCK